MSVASTGLTAMVVGRREQFRATCATPRRSRLSRIPDPRKHQGVGRLPARFCRPIIARLSPQFRKPILGFTPATVARLLKLRLAAVSAGFRRANLFALECIKCL